MDWLPWAPLAAACCHIFEEFVWPGGFPAWYRQYRLPSRVSTLMLATVNVALLTACVTYALLANTQFGVAALLGISALLFSNGLWHAYASVKSHTVSPGVVTGILLYVPLIIVEFNGYFRTGRVSVWMAVVTMMVGGSYHVWSALYHRLGAKASA